MFEFIKKMIRCKPLEIPSMSFEEFVKEEEKKDGQCRHDWEIVPHSGDIVKVTAAVTWYERIAYTPDSVFPHTAVRVIPPTNRVCVKCAKCEDEQVRFEIAYRIQEKKYREEKKATRRRKAFAKQLWEDGCNERA